MRLSTVAALAAAALTLAGCGGRAALRGRNFYRGGLAAQRCATTVARR